MEGLASTSRLQLRSAIATGTGGNLRWTCFNYLRYIRGGCRFYASQRKLLFLRRNW